MTKAKGKPKKVRHAKHGVLPTKSDEAWANEKVTRQEKGCTLSCGCVYWDGKLITHHKDRLP